MMELDNGRQGYVVCPLIERIQKRWIFKCEDTYEDKRILNSYKIAILHGKMSEQKKKMKIVERFLNKERCIF